MGNSYSNTVIIFSRQWGPHIVSSYAYKIRNVSQYTYAIWHYFANIKNTLLFMRKKLKPLDSGDIYAEDYMFVWVKPV